MKKFFFILLAPALALWVDGCSPASPQKKSEEVPVLVAKSSATNVPVQIVPPPVGHAMAYSTVTVRSQIPGKISEIHFQQGQEVKKGDLLFTIDSRPAETALTQSRANLARDRAQLENAKIQFDREQKLFDQKLVSQDGYDTSKAAMDALAGTVQADAAAVTNAETNLGYCQIRSPIDGVTGGLQAFAGNVIKAPDDALVTINQIHPIYVQFGVLEQYLPEIRREMHGKTLPVTVNFQNMDAPPPQGKLTFVDNSVDQTTGMIQLKATFPNEDSALWPGQFVQVQLTLADLTNAVVVPSPAVQTGQNGQFIYVVKPDQTVDEQPVTTGVTYQGWTVVEKGLQAGETVVTDGQLRLAPGVKVSLKSESPATNAP